MWEVGSGKILQEQVLRESQASWHPGYDWKDYYPFFFLTEMEGNREDLSQIGEGMLGCFCLMISNFTVV